MRILKVTAILLALGFVSFLTVGCETDKPGMTNTLGTYSTNIDGTPDKVTTAAVKAAGDLKLQNINSGAGGTAVDGQVTAQTADGTNVTISITQAGDKVSKVAIRAGVSGDESLSTQLMDRIRAHMSWL